MCGILRKCRKQKTAVTMYKLTSTKQSIPFGQGQETPIATWTDDYDTISMIEDDHCYLFILESTGNIMQWIPKEIITSLQELSIPAESAVPDFIP